MERYLIDTNVVSDYLSASFSSAGLGLMDEALDATPNISIITQIELLCWKTDESTIENIKQFIADCIIYDINSDVINHCVNLRKSKKIKTPDAIIAATALAHGFTIITSNEKDFNNIKGLKILNPNSMKVNCFITSHSLYHHRQYTPHYLAWPLSWPLSVSSQRIWAIV